MKFAEFFAREANLSAQPVHILLVEDDEVDVEAVHRAFAISRITNPITVVGNGLEALDALRGEHGRERLPRPYIILLDINLPLMNGIEFLQHLRQDRQLRSSVVFVLSTSSDEADIVAAYKSQVAGYFLKTQIAAGVFALPEMMKTYWRMVAFPADLPREPQTC
jgi:CheY-like chemotaxis protein